MRFVIFAIALLSVFSCGTASSDQLKPGSPALIPPSSNGEKTAMITGRVQIYGNEPHTFVGIVDDSGVEYAVYPPSREAELRKLQGHLIVFTVIMLPEPQGEGGMYLRGGTVTPLGWEIIR
jgi:hypothetical protein